MSDFLDDELPSLFAFDASNTQSLAPLSEPTDLSESASLSASPVEPLSAEEISALLHDIESEDDLRHELQSPRPLLPANTQRQQQQQHKPRDGDNGGGSGISLQKKKKKPSYNSNKARNGRKEELLYLRRTVMELETQLDALQKKSAAVTDSDTTMSIASLWSDEPSPSSSLHMSFQQQLGAFTASERQSNASLLLQDSAASQNDGELADVWKEIARHQMDERGRSERENIRLRLVLENQLKVARSLEKFLMLKAAASSMEITKSVDVRRYPNNVYDDQSKIEALVSTNQLTDAAIYKELLAGVEQSLLEVDAVYDTNGLARKETSQLNAQMRFDAERRGLRVEVCATKVLPFGIYETGAAVWNHYLFAKQRMPSRYYSYHSHKSIDTTDDTIVEDFNLELHGKDDTRASFRMRQIMRRHVDDDGQRIVIVWRSFFDPLQFSDQPLSGVRFFEKGYIVIKKSCNGKSTLLQPCYNISPFHTAGIMGDTVGAITDFMLSTTAANVAATHQMIENVLLEQALKRKETTGGGGDVWMV